MLMFARAYLSIFPKGSNLVRMIGNFGALGLIVVGVLDSSLIPLPGSTDVFTVWLAAGHRHPWPYYALAATLSSVVGGYLTYRLGRKGGKEALETKFPKQKVEKIYKKFEGWGFWGVLISALLPPPYPITAALLGAGAMQYSRTKFLAALVIGRGARYAIIAYLGYRYGPMVLTFFSKYYKPALITLAGMSALAIGYALMKYLKFRRERHQHGPIQNAAG